jgi:arylsulfatase A-like enzyme
MTLAEVLRRSGYSTAGFVSNVYVNSIFGFAQGFDVYDDEHDDYSRQVAKIKRRAEETTRRAFRWLEEEVEEPFFLFVHYNDPHWPYNPPAPFGAEFVSGYRGELTPADTTGVVQQQGEPVTGLSDDDLAYIVGLYDGEIQYVDRHVGRLLKRIDAGDWERDLLVVFTSDHGEEFLDHGSTSHGYTLYEEQIQVPLIFRFEGHLKPRRIQTQVRLIDILPSILAAAGIDGTELILQGQSLLPLATGNSKEGPAFAYSEAAYVGDQKAIRARSGVKLIRDFAADVTRVFDLSSDPDERRDLWDAEATSQQNLVQGLQTWVEGNRDLASSAFAGDDASKRVVLDQEITDQLEALGYVQ